MTRAAASTIVVVGILFLFAIGGCESAGSVSDESMSGNTYNLPTDIAGIPNLIERESFSVDLIEGVHTGRTGPGRSSSGWKLQIG